MACSTHHSTTCSCSLCDSVGLSPVVPTGTRPLVPSAICQSTSSRNAFSSTEPFLNGVTSAVKEPRNLVLAVMAVLDSLVGGARGRRRGTRYQQNIGSAWSMKEPCPANVRRIRPVDELRPTVAAFPGDLAFINLINAIASGAIGSSRTAEGIGDWLRTWLHEHLQFGELRSARCGRSPRTALASSCAVRLPQRRCRHDGRCAGQRTSRQEGQPTRPRPRAKKVEPKKARTEAQARHASSNRNPSAQAQARSQSRTKDKKQVRGQGAGQARHQASKADARQRGPASRRQSPAVLPTPHAPGRRSIPSPATHGLDRRRCRRPPTPSSPPPPSTSPPSSAPSSWCATASRPTPARSRRSISDPAAKKLVEWVILRSDDSGADFARYTAFITANPTWPSIVTLRRKAEATAFQDQPPNAAGAGLFLAVSRRSPPRAASRSPAPCWPAATAARPKAQVREAWRYDGFSQDVESRVIESVRRVPDRAPTTRRGWTAGSTRRTTPRRACARRRGSAATSR